MKANNNKEDDEYNKMSFNREGMRFSDAMKSHHSGTQRDFLENKLNNSPTKLRIEDFIGSTLSKLQDKVKDEITVGVSEVSPQKSALSNLNKKFQIELTSSELNNTLSLNRGKKCAVVTKDDYIKNKQLVEERLKEIHQFNEEDANKIIEELSKIHKTSTGVESKSLIGKVNFGSRDDNDNSVELAKQMVKKLQDEKREHKAKMKEVKAKRKELKAKKLAEEEKRK